MHEHHKRFVAFALAAFLAGCGGHGNSSPVLPNQPQTIDQQTNPLATQSAPIGTDASTLSTSALSTTFTTDGLIVALHSGGFSLRSSQGTVVVRYTPATIVYTKFATIALGHYASVAGTGTLASGINAAYVAASATPPAPVTVSGTFAGYKTYGMLVQSGIHGYIPVLAGSATRVTGTLSTGATVSITGTGSASIAIVASAISTSDGTASGDATPAAVSGSTSMRHVMTVDYIGTPFGTTSVSPARAAAYLSWAVTGSVNLNAMASAGMRTMMYVDVNRQQSTDPLYRAGETAFAHACSGSRVHDIHDSVVQYLMNPGSSTLRTAYAKFIESRTAGSTLTAVFQDDSVPPGIYPAGFFSPSLPCGYSLASWQVAQRGLQASINHNTILNGIAVSGTWPLLDNPSTIGGNYEGCYTEAAALPERGGAQWIAIQQTHLYVTGRGKFFECMGLDKASAAYAIRSRLYQLASFLMVYNPSRSLLWETYATPSHLTVMPESQLVALTPVVSVSAIASLRTATGAYAREYRQCFYAGRAIGACAMVVNPDGSAHTAPRLALAYHHTIVLHGYGAVDGGTVTFGGPAPPSAMGGLTAYVAVP